MAVAFQALLVVYIGLAFAPVLQRQIELDCLDGSSLDMTGPADSSKMSVGAMGWAATTPLLGVAVVVLSYRLRVDQQWWSDATMTLGFTILLIGPVLFLTRQLERRTGRQIREVRQELTRDVENLRQSVVEAQEAVTAGLESRDAAATSAFEAVLHDTSYAAFEEFMTTADEEGLLSPIGIRADVENADFFVRLKRVDEGALVLVLDGVETPAIFTQQWTRGLSLDQVLLELSDQVRPTRWWPGVGGWDFTAAIESFSGLFTLALEQRRRGLQPSTPVQRVGDWLLSDWDARPVSHPTYQVTYGRLDDSDWYDHLTEKIWTDDYDVRQMLVNAEFLRKLSGAN